MKAGWEVRPLGEVIQIKPPKREVQGRLRPDQAVSFVPMEDLGELQRRFAPQRERPLSEVYGSYTYFAEDDVLLAKITPCFENGKLGIARGLESAVGFGSSEFMVLRCSEQLAPEYLFYFLSRDEFRELGRARMSGAVGHKRIPPEYVQSLEIPLPPLDEQRRIVAILDEAFEGLDRARANAEANLVSAGELFESALGWLFNSDSAGWTTAPLQHVVEPDCTLSYGIVQPGDDKPNGLPIVRPTDLGERLITLDGLKRIDPDRAAGYGRTKLRGGEILLCVRGSTGVVSLASEELRDANVTRGIVPVRFDRNQIDHRLGYYQFLSKPVQDQIRAKTYGAALMQINISDLRQLMISVPPADEQGALLERIESVTGDFDELVARYRAKVEGCVYLRQSILQKAFAGELT